MTTWTNLMRLLVAEHLAAMFYVGVAGAQGPITSGETANGAISQPGESDSWTFAANVGDTINLRIGEVIDNGNFDPRIELFGPTGVLLGSATGAQVAAIGFAGVTATASGTHTVVVSGRNGTGTYRLHLAKVPGDFVVPSGDDGGPLTNGGNHEGTIHLADLDLWSFTAAKDDNIVLRIGELTEDDDSSFSPQILLYGPDGTLLTYASGTMAAQVTQQAPATGTYTVLVNDGGGAGTGGIVGTGTYRLHFAKVPGDFVVPSGDDGGVLVPSQPYDGAVHLGDLDLWSFAANSGDRIVVRITKLTDDGNSFVPQIFLYGPDGRLLNYSSGSMSAEIIQPAPTTGTFTVLVTDGGGAGTGGIVGTGTYRLTISGITASSPTATVPSTAAPSNSPTPTPTMNPAVFPVTGTCLQPGDQGLVSCDAGTTTITVSVCRTDLTCNIDTLTLLDSTVVDDNGAFSFLLDTAQVRRRRLVFQATFGQGLVHSQAAGGTAGQTADANQFRVIDLGPAAAGGRLDGVLIDPSSEAAVQLLSRNGLQNYSNDAIARMTQSVRAALDGQSFAGLGRSEAVMRAIEIACMDPDVQAVLQQTLIECAGDCDGSGALAIDELVVLVNIALGTSPVSACLIGDGDDNGQIAINELITAVNAALRGPCASRSGSSACESALG